MGVHHPAREPLNPREGWHMGSGIVTRRHHHIVKPVIDVIDEIDVTRFFGIIFSHMRAVVIDVIELIDVYMGLPRLITLLAKMHVYTFPHQ